MTLMSLLKDWNFLSIIKSETKKMGELSKKVVDEKLSWKVIAKKFLE